MPRLYSFILLLSGLWPPSLPWGRTRILCSAESVKTFSGIWACLRSNTSLGKYWHTLEKNKPSQKKNPICQFSYRFHICFKHAGQKNTPQQHNHTEKIVPHLRERSSTAALNTLEWIPLKAIWKVGVYLEIQMNYKKRQEQRASHPIYSGSCLQRGEPHFGTQLFSDTTGCQHGWLRLDADSWKAKFKW